jgi:hypothetical protein
VFEFPASGGIVPSYSFRTVKLYRYAVADTILSLVGMCTVVMFIVYFTLEEILEISYFRLRYFTKFWNDVDFGILLVSRLYLRALDQSYHLVKHNFNSELGHEFQSLYLSSGNRFVNLQESSVKIPREIGPLVCCGTEIELDLKCFW